MIMCALLKELIFSHYDFHPTLSFKMYEIDNIGATQSDLYDKLTTSISSSKDVVSLPIDLTVPTFEIARIVEFDHQHIALFYARLHQEGILVFPSIQDFEQFKKVIELCPNYFTLPHAIPHTQYFLVDQHHRTLYKDILADILKIEKYLLNHSKASLLSIGEATKTQAIALQDKRFKSFTSSLLYYIIDLVMNETQQRLSLTYTEQLTRNGYQYQPICKAPNGSTFPIAEKLYEAFIQKRVVNAKKRINAKYLSIDNTLFYQSVPSNLFYQLTNPYLQETYDLYLKDMPEFPTNLNGASSAKMPPKGKQYFKKK